ncbi:nickel ABC transporter substrate-binding protein [Vibrio quintilis]|nr:nickel ABC transporter substrate-binding protein [Vibrio quintilis]
MSIRRLFTVWATFIFTLPLTGFAHSSASLNIAWPVNVGELNPHLYTPNQMFAQSMVYEPLVQYQADGQVKPWLATHWDISKDGRVYTFTLRHGVRFSDGEPFNAQAVVANFQAVLDNKARHSWLELVNEIESIQATAPDKVVLTLKHAYYPLLQELALPRPFRFIAPSQFVDGTTKNGIKKPVGTGPWVLKETRYGQYDRFERNPGYWGEKPAYQQITVKVIADPTSRAMALQTGEVDLLYGVNGIVSPDMFDQLSHSKRWVTQVSDPVETSMLALNSSRFPTSDLSVRQAINHAVNKEMLVQTVLYNTQQPAKTLFAPNIPYADIQIQPYQFDLNLARQLLEKDGWHLPEQGTIRMKNGQKLSIDLVFTGTNAVQKSIAEVIQGDLQQAGIQVSLIAEEESSVFARQRNGRFGMIFNATWGAPYDPHAFIGSMRVPAHADYQAQKGLPDKKIIDAKIKQVLLTSDATKRRELYRNIMTRLHDDAVYLPLIWISSWAIASPSVGNLHFAPMTSDIPLNQFKPVRN